jgi:hypothetical protein
MPVTTIYLSAWSSPQYGNFTVAIDPSEITGRRDPAGGVLQIPVSTEPEDYRTEQVIVALEGWLRTSNDPASVLGIHAPLQTIPPNYRFIRFLVTHSQLAHIETQRAGGDALFALTLGGLANVPHGPIPDGQAHSPAAFTRPVRDNGNAAMLTIPQQQWLKVLREMGYGEVRTIELPMLSLKGIGGHWDECVRLLTKASDEHRTARSESAMASVRLIVEGLATVIAEAWGVPRKPSKSFEEWLKELQGRMAGVWPEDAEAAKVLTTLYLTVWQWTSEAHHYRSRIPLYKEAGFAVGLAGELLAFAVQLLQAHPEPIKISPSPTSTDGSV